MAKFLTTSKTVSGIEHVITCAKTQLVLISPFLQISKILFERLQNADEKGVVIIIVYGKDKIKEEVRSMFSQLEHLKLYYYENLHAKCYYNEQHLVITSMNLFEYSEKNNREMGVFVNRNKDEELYREAVEESEAIIKKAELIILKKSNAKVESLKRKEKENRIQNQEGHCVRCSTNIDFDPFRPFCYNCYQNWAFYGNSFYTENYCHDCNKESDTCMQRPLCRSCERKFLKKNPNVAFTM